MIEKGGIYPTEGIIYGMRAKGPWALVKVFGQPGENVNQLWIQNPTQIKGCERIKVVEILRAYEKSRKVNGVWLLTMNVDVIALPADTAYRETSEGIVTPEDDIAAFLFGVQGRR